MKRKLNQLFLAAALMCGAMSVTSCEGLIDAIIGDHTGSSSGSTTKPVTPDDPVNPDDPKTPEPEPVTLTTSVDQLKIAEQEGAYITFWFMFEGDFYRAIFKKVGNDYVLKNDVASTRTTARAFTRNSGEVKSVSENDKLQVLLNLLNNKYAFYVNRTTKQEDGTTTSEAVLQAVIDAGTGSISQKTERVDTRVVALSVKDHDPDYDPQIESIALHLLNNEEVESDERDAVLNAYNEGKFDNMIILTSGISLGTENAPCQLMTISELNEAVNKENSVEDTSQRVDGKDVSDRVYKETGGYVEDLEERVDKGETDLRECYVTDFEIITKTLSLNVGESAKLEYTIGPENADKTVSWGSSDETVATVDKNGNVRAVGPGNAIISGTPHSEMTIHKECKVTVKKKTGSISYPAEPVEKLTTDAAFTIELTKVGDGEVTYKSSKESVAIVDENGKVTIKGAGETTITATVEDSDTYTYATKSVSYTLTVTEPQKPQEPQSAISNPVGYTDGGDPRSASN